MKRIGILTRHCYPNYGSILQAFALESALRQLGANPVVIDYVRPGDRPLGLVNATLRVSHMRNLWWKRLIYRVVQTPTFLSMALTFRRHQRRLLTLTKEAHDAASLKQIARGLDSVVAGSDQVWNRITGTLDLNYFLDFMDGPEGRLSYAASLGSSKPLDEDLEEVLAALRKMSQVSVREPSALEWLASNGISARADVDPVLLHDRPFWNSFAGPKRDHSQYILAYQLQNTEKFSKRLEEIGARHDLPVFRITPDWKNLVRSGRTKILVSPESFVAWIRDATCVVTDSFHGTAFSLRLGVPLYVIPPEKFSTRLMDMIARVGLERLMVPSASDGLGSISPDYDVSAVQNALNLQAVESWEYLKRIVSA